MTIQASDLESPERLMNLAQSGRFSKADLAPLLCLQMRHEYFEMCATIEKRLTETCTASGNPCLEGGCSADGEICLEPVLSAGLDYSRACGAVFATLYADPQNRNGA